MLKITISYRRDDAAAITGRLYDRLVGHYGRDSVFMDLTDVPTGVDFRVSVDETVQRSDILLVIIGHRWSGPADDGRPRIADRADPIRAGLATALANGTTVIPILVDGAAMPASATLPEDVRGVADITPAKIESGGDFDIQVGRLLRAIDIRLGEQRKSEFSPVRQLRDALFRPIRTADGEPYTYKIGKRIVQTLIAAADPPANPYRPNTPEYWLHHVAVTRKLTPGDEPIVMISYASQDRSWVVELRAFLDRRIEQLRNRDGRSYALWNFADIRLGTRVGDEFPDIVAEKMWRCQLAIVVLSKDYFNSTYCRTVELPFLMWRRGHHGLMCFPVRLGAVPIDMIRLPGYERPPSKLRLDDIIDDRQAPMDFANSLHRALTLKQLKEQGLESEIENRFDGLSRRVFEFLMARYEAVEDA